MYAVVAVIAAAAVLAVILAAVDAPIVLALVPLAIGAVALAVLQVYSRADGASYTPPAGESAAGDRATRDRETPA